MTCEHKQTIVVDNALAEWCEDCGAFRVKTVNPWRGDRWFYPKGTPVTYKKEKSDYGKAEEEGMFSS